MVAVSYGNDTRKGPLVAPSNARKNIIIDVLDINIAVQYMIIERKTL